MPAALDSAGLLRARRMRRSGQRAWWDGGFRVRAAATCLSVCVCLSVCHQGWRLRPTARGRPRGKLAGLAGWPEPSYQSTEAGRGWRLVEARGRPELDLALVGCAGGRLCRRLWAAAFHIGGPSSTLSALRLTTRGTRWLSRWPRGRGRPDSRRHGA